MTEKKQDKGEEKYAVKVDKSTLPHAGRGVFVEKECKAGTVMCFLDGYAKPSKTTKMEQEYERQGADGQRIIGYMVPRTQGGVAQLVNDAVQPDFAGFDPTRSAEEQFLLVSNAYLKYSTLSIMRANVWAPEGCASPLAALRDLAPGDELFVHHGLRHWIWRLTPSADLLRTMQRVVDAVDSFVQDTLCTPSLVKKMTGKAASPETVALAHLFIGNASIIQARKHAKLLLAQLDSSSADDAKKTRRQRPVRLDFGLKERKIYIRTFAIFQKQWWGSRASATPMQ